MTHSAASQTAAQVVKKNLVARVPGEDARQRITRLTPKAERLLPVPAAEREGDRPGSRPADWRLSCRSLSVSSTRRSLRSIGAACASGSATRCRLRRSLRALAIGSRRRSGASDPRLWRRRIRRDANILPVFPSRSLSCPQGTDSRLTGGGGRGRLNISNECSSRRLSRDEFPVFARVFACATEVAVLGR